MRVLVPLAASLALAAGASAADWPTAFGVAERGSLRVVSNVRLGPSGGEMKGVWLDDDRSCRDRRALRVSIQIDLVSADGKTTRVRRTRQALVDNCAEGGPNFGFDLKPKALGLGCASGRWRPGRYSMTTRTLHVASGVAAHASLYHQVTRRC